MIKNTAKNTRVNPLKLWVILAIQFIVLLLAIIILLATGFSELTIKSVIAGALIFSGPNVYFTYYAFRHSGARAATEVAQSFYRGESGKFILTAVLFAVLFAAVKPIDAVAVFLAYIVMMVLAWLTALRMMK